MAEQDEDIQRMEQEAQAKLSRQRQVALLGNIPTTIKILVVVGVIVLVYSNLIPNMTSTAKMLITIAAFVFLILSTGIEPEPRMLTEQEILVLANKQMKYKQKHPLSGDVAQVPQGEIKWLPECTAMWREWGSPSVWLWIHACNIYNHATGRMYHRVVIQEPYFGDIRRIATSEEGFTGKEYIPQVWITTSDFKKKLYAAEIIEDMKEERRGG